MRGDFDEDEFDEDEDQDSDPDEEDLCVDCGRIGSHWDSCCIDAWRGPTLTRLDA